MKNLMTNSDLLTISNLSKENKIQHYKLFSRLLTVFGMAMIFAVSSWGKTTTDIKLEKTAPITVNTNASLVYTLTVSNISSPAKDAGTIQVVDTLPIGVTYVNYSGTNWSCLQALQIITCDYSQILTGGNNTVLTINTTAPNSTGPIQNTAVVSMTNTANSNGYEDSDTTNNSSSATTTVQTPPQPTVYFTTTTNSANEGNTGTTNIPYTVTLSAPPTSAVSVLYTITGSGTNAADSADFVTTSGTLNFTIGTTSQTLNVPVQGDTTFEEDETFTVTLGTPTGATLGTASATGTILNDDAATNNTPTVSISPDTVSVPEGITTTDLQITLDEAPNTGDLNVTYTNSYDSSTGYLIIPQDVSSSTLTIDTSSMVQGTEFNITLTGATGISGQNNGIVSSDNNFSTISIAAAVPDLSISKIDSADPVDAGTGFDYTIRVYNKGSATATGISVIDTLPSGLAIDLTTSNTDSVDWNCTRSGDVLTCLYDGNITAGETKTILLHATAPSTAGTITNNASVTISNSDYDTSNNNATETTRIVSVGYQEIDEANELCYSDITPLTFTTYATDCEKVGNFYYGDGCTATVLIKANNNLTTNLTDVNVTKMIAVSNNKDLDDGSCTSTQGNCSGPVPFAPDWSPSYLEAYVIPDVGTMISDANFTISDTNTHNKKPLYQIAIYATYNYDGVYHYGRVKECSGLSEGGILIEYTADAIDTPIAANNVATYNASNDTSSNGLKYIQTMVAASLQRNITGVHLDINTKEAEPYVFTGDPGNYSPFVIIPYLVDTDENGKCGSNFELLYDATGNELVIPIETGEYSGTKTITVPNGVRKNARLQLIMVDPNLLSEDGQDCLATSSTSGNLEGIGQCGNSEGQYIAGYTVDAWDRCGINNGSPCLSKHGGYSGGSDPTYPGYNPIYDNVLGCYMCTFDIQPACSTDNFAIRPEKFDAGMSDTDAPNLLRSGEEYGVSLTAKDALDNIPAEYTVTDHNFNNDLDTNTTRYFKDGTVDTNGLLHGTSDLNKSTTAYMVAGLSSLSTTQPASAQEIVQSSYDDIGLVGLKVYDKNWAAVDNDDTPMDCNSSEHTYICGELNVTFIPHHFGFSELNITNHAGPDSNFTYIADNRGMPSTTPPPRSPMAARVQTRIEALNKNNNITQNFRTGSLYYENNISITQTVVVPVFGSPNGYLYPDANESNITDKLVGFGRSGIDDNGTRNIAWDESTYSLDFNFRREINQPANPFDVNGSYLSISLVSRYIDPDDSDIADINGSRIGDQNGSTTCATDPGCVELNADSNATFYYGRARPSQYFYDDVTTSSAQTPIAIDVYCDFIFSECSKKGIDIDNAQINEADWWLSLNHTENSTRHDGNITLQRNPAGSAIISAPSTSTEDPAEVRITSGGIDQTVTVTATTAGRPLTVDIELVHNMLPFTLPYYTASPPYTNSWLIYNADSLDLPSPFYKVRFIGTSDWAGHGDTGHVVGGNTNTKKNRRLGW